MIFFKVHFEKCKGDFDICKITAMNSAHSIFTCYIDHFSVSGCKNDDVVNWASSYKKLH